VPRPACQYVGAIRVNNASGAGALQSPERLLTLQATAPIVLLAEGSAAGGGARQRRVATMARRRASKARSSPGPVRAGTARGKPAGAKDRTEAPGGLRAQLVMLERERDELRAELARSEARRRRLEETHAQVRDRIAWALDSLHNILGGKG
jgi:hypothetical protein